MQLLVAVGTVLTSIVAGVASILVKNYMEKKEHDALCSQRAIEPHTKAGTAFCTSVPVGHSCPFECGYGFVKIGDLKC